MIATQTTAEACALAVLGLSGSGDAGAAHSAAVLGAAELRFGFNDAGTLTFGTMTIKNPGDLAARVVEGDTMLHVAVRSSLQDVCGALLAPNARAPLGVRNARGETAFEVAVAGDAPAETKEDAEADADLRSPCRSRTRRPPKKPKRASFFSFAGEEGAGGRDRRRRRWRDAARVARARRRPRRRRRRGGGGGGGRAAPGPVVSAEQTQRIRELENTVAVLRGELQRSRASGAGSPPPGAPAPASRRSIEAIEDELRAATARCLAGDPTAEADLERLDAALRAHPDFAVRRASEKARWDRDERAANRAALKATRGLVPPDILRSTAAKVREDVSRAVGPGAAADALAKRVWGLGALRLARAPAAMLRKAHIADLRGRYALAGAVDVVELRAIYAALPRDFDNDGDGAKAAWREQPPASMYGTLMGMTGLVSSKGRGPTPPPAGPAGKAKGCAAAAKAAKASKASKAPRVNHAPAPAPASEAARPKAKVLKASAAGGAAASLAPAAPLDAGCHLIEMCTGKLVTYERKKAFLIAHEYAGLGKHKDGNRDNQGPTLLITLDAPTDYVGGGTRFHPGDGWEGEPEAAPPPMDVRPGKGCGVTFGPKIQHEGLRITAGRRHLLCIFPDLVPEAAPEPEKRRVRDSQRHAALVVFGRLKKKA
ncbi:hypothetical protein JL722_13539 [Aureococcus anophagefferens]|nr:hypothetical protein JL722_13539 [Aureococcus anophagefferens]